MRLIDAGARLLVVDARTVSVFDARSLRRLSSVAITPTPAAPSAAAISPDGATIAIGSRTGQVSFVDPSTGHARPGTGAHGTRGDQLSPTRPTVARSRARGNDNKVIVWNPRPHAGRGPDRPGRSRCKASRSARTEQTLYTSSLGGVLLEWDLTGDRSFGRRFALGPRIAVLPDRSRRPRRRSRSRRMARTFAVRLGTSTVGLVLHPHAAPAGIVHDRAKGHRDHRARVVTHPARTRRRRLLRPRPAVARGRHAAAGALADRPAPGARGTRSDPSPRVLSRRPTPRRERQQRERRHEELRVPT